ncbi:MAG: hypothetical protein U9O20_04600 [Patescibacteria group bacterium]|nr:hypothetical protein [Patescibacteria group bacterium]
MEITEEQALQEGEVLGKKEEKNAGVKGVSAELGKDGLMKELERVEKEKNTEKKEGAIEQSRKKLEKSNPVKKISSAGKAEVSRHAKEIGDLDDADQQVEKLVQLAQNEDPFVAIKVAQHLDDNFVLDQLHDGLLEEKTRKVLVDKGLLKNI